MLISKELLGYLSLIATLLRFSIYFYSIFKRHTKPHVFSWITWGILTSINFYAQYSNKAGHGAWATGLIAASCFTVAIMALFWGEKDIKRSDYYTFIAALLIIPLWYFTANPLLAVIMTVVIDVLGAYYPTFRKSYYKPYEETLFLYTIGIFQATLSLMAMDHYYLVNIIYPTVTLCANSSFACMVASRRNIISKKGQALGQ